MLIRIIQRFQVQFKINRETRLHIWHVLRECDSFFDRLLSPMTNLANAARAAVFIHARVRLEQPLLRSNLVSAVFENDLSILRRRRLLGHFVSLQHVHHLILHGWLGRGRATSMIFPSALIIDRENSINPLPRASRLKQ